MGNKQSIPKKQKRTSKHGSIEVDDVSSSSVCQIKGTCSADALDSNTAHASAALPNDTAPGTAALDKLGGVMNAMQNEMRQRAFSVFHLQEDENVIIFEHEEAESTVSDEDKQGDFKVSPKRWTPLAPFEQRTRIPKAGTLSAIVQWMCCENLDHELVQQFLLTYKFFNITARDVFQTLVALYQQVPTMTSSEESSGKLHKTFSGGLSSVTKQVRLWHQKRIIKFAATMIKSCSDRELKQPNGDGASLVQEVADWVKVLHADGFTYDCRSLVAIVRKYGATIAQQQRSQSIAKSPSNSSSANPSPRAPMLSRSNSAVMSPTMRRLTQLAMDKEVTACDPSKMQLTNFTPQQIATQLQNIEFNLYRKIDVSTEFPGLAWTKAEGKKIAPNVSAMINRFNMVSYWVATELITASSVKKQTNLLILFIATAKECRDRNNFNSLMEILAGLNLHCVSQLKEAWHGVPEKYSAIMKDLDSLMSSIGNYKHYRRLLTNIVPKSLLSPPTSPVPSRPRLLEQPRSLSDDSGVNSKYRNSRSNSNSSSSNNNNNNHASYSDTLLTATRERSVSTVSTSSVIEHRDSRSNSVASTTATTRERSDSNASTSSTTSTSSTVKKSKSSSKHKTQPPPEDIKVATNPLFVPPPPAIPTSPPPIVPYLGVHLRDLTFHQENPNKVGNNQQLINFAKMRLLGAIIQDIKSFQKQPNDTPDDPIVHNYLSNLISVDEDTLYQFVKDQTSSAH